MNLKKESCFKCGHLKKNKKNRLRKLSRLNSTIIHRWWCAKLPIYFRRLCKHSFIFCVGWTHSIEWKGLHRLNILFIIIMKWAAENCATSVFEIHNAKAIFQSSMSFWFQLIIYDDGHVLWRGIPIITASVGETEKKKHENFHTNEDNVKTQKDKRMRTDLCCHYDYNHQS